MRSAFVFIGLLHYALPCCIPVWPVAHIVGCGGHCARVRILETSKQLSSPTVISTLHVSTNCPAAIAPITHRVDHQTAPASAGQRRPAGGLGALHCLRTSIAGGQQGDHDDPPGSLALCAAAAPARSPGRRQPPRPGDCSHSTTPMRASPGRPPPTAHLGPLGLAALPCTPACSVAPTAPGRGAPGGHQAAGCRRRGL
jgi:hypothetical protein